MRFCWLHIPHCWKSHLICCMHCKIGFPANSFVCCIQNSVDSDLLAAFADLNLHCFQNMSGSMAIRLFFHVSIKFANFINGKTKTNETIFLLIMYRYFLLSSYLF